MITDPEQIFSFGFVLGILTGWASTQLWFIVKRMNERARDEQLSRQQLRMRQWDDQ